MSNPFGSKEDNPLMRNCQNHLSHPSLSHKRMLGEFDSRKDSHLTKFEQLS